MRHGLLTDYDPRRGVSISTLAHEYPRGHRVKEHAHGAGQLVYAIGGVMRVSVGRSLWVVPPHFAIWIPAYRRHAIVMTGPVSMRTLYLRRTLAARLSRACAVLHVVPLLRELIVEAVRLGELRRTDPLHCALRDLLLARLERASPLPTFVTRPTDPRACRVANLMLADPAERRSLAQMCESAGASVRTIQRIFRREVGTDFDSWRRQVRLVRAVELLVAGESVKQTAFALGYRQTTAFVAMFRDVLGSTPGAWIRALRGREPGR